MTATRTNWPVPRDPNETERDMGVVFWSRFPDVTGVWNVDGSLESNEQEVGK